MTNEEIKKSLSEKFPMLADWDEQYGLLSFRSGADKGLEVLQYLFHNLGFQFLTDLTAVHYPEKAGEELCVVYHLHNLVENVRIKMKIFVPVAKPDVFSATSVFAGANWMERETYDFFGVNFVGHPDLKRILNVDDMDYFPMRKEYPMEDPTRTDKDDEMFGRG